MLASEHSVTENTLGHTGIIMMTKNTRSFRGLSRSLLVGLAFSTAIGVCAAQADAITVYTSYEEDEMAAFLARAKEDMPDLDVNVLRLSTGDLHARILAEASNPQHDVI